jgi:ATP-dependent helicase/nuclease subunit B
MTPFLERLAEAMVQEHGTAMQDIAVVLPSQRAALYLRPALARAAGKALWSPELLTLPVLMQRLSGLRVPPPEELALHAYDAYRTVTGEEAASLPEFLQWAPAALRDMSEADAHLVPLDGFYRDLRSWEDLDWSFNEEPLSPGQLRMVRYWAMKGRLHTAVNERLHAEQAGTTGAVERLAAEHPVASPWSTIWFAGLNALTPAQERVLDHCRKLGIARFAWDADRYYLNDVKQEAGMHLRKAIERFGPGVIPPVDELRSCRLRLHVLRASNDMAQAWSAASWVSDLPEEAREGTTLVLADRGLLTPLLEALPGDIGPVNVTMGISVATLPAGSLVESFLEFHRGQLKGKGALHADVQRLLRHPFLQQGEAGRTLHATLQRLAAPHRMFVPADALQRLALELPAEVRAYAADAVRPAQDGAVDMPARITALLAWVRPLIASDKLATEQLYQTALALERLHRLLRPHLPALDLNTYTQSISRLLRTAQVGFFGEPLQGLQVMGFLETRALNPRHVVVLGAQEGKLPADTSGTSFIPFELRRAYGLPLRDGPDAVQAYNFLRMLHGAEQVTLLHTDDEGAGGPSRFILQLQHELLREAPERYTEQHVRVPLAIRSRVPIRVGKDESISEALRAMLARGLSPSKLGTWLRCPLDFHLRFVVGLKETDPIAARIPPNVLGDALHNCVERIYRPWIGQPLDPDALVAAAGTVPELLRHALGEHLPVHTLSAGQPLLQVGMAAHAAQRFLRNEAGDIRRGSVIIPLALEAPLSSRVPGAEQRLGVPFSLVGRSDRIDERDGIINILDLKTGRVKDADLHVQELTIDALRGDKQYAAQLLTYAWLYLDRQPEVPAVRAGLLPLQRPSASGGIHLRIDGNDHIHRGLMPAMESFFLDIAAAMLDPEVPIEHDPRSRYCAFCVGE